VDLLLPAEAVTASLGEGWTESESGVLGEFHLMNYLLGDEWGYAWPAYGYEGRQYLGTEVLVWQAGQGWQGDHYRIFENGEELVLVVVVRFKDRLDAQQFHSTHGYVLTRGAATDTRFRLPYTMERRSDGMVVTRFHPVGSTVFFAIGTNWEVGRKALEPLVRGQAGAASGSSR
jgi:hypothetical protein